MPQAQGQVYIFFAFLNRAGRLTKSVSDLSQVTVWGSSTTTAFSTATTDTPTAPAIPTVTAALGTQVLELVAASPADMAAVSLDDSKLILSFLLQ